jgi:hypothetical protein
MLTIAALGMFSYGAYSVGWAALDLIRGARLEIWAEAAIMLFGLLLALSAAFVRVQLPGGLALAIGSMLGLQAMAVHTAAHLDGGLAPQIMRASAAAVLAALGFAGQNAGARDRRAGDSERASPF